MFESLVWHQFDYVQHSRKDNLDEEVNSMIHPGKTVYRDVRDAQLAMMTYLPTWNGFKETTPHLSCADWMETIPSDAVKLYLQILHCMQDNQLAIRHTPESFYGDTALDFPKQKPKEFQPKEVFFSCLIDKMTRYKLLALDGHLVTLTWLINQNAMEIYVIPVGEKYLKFIWQDKSFNN